MLILFCTHNLSRYYITLRRVGLFVAMLPYSPIFENINVSVWDLRWTAVIPVYCMQYMGAVSLFKHFQCHFFCICELSQTRPSHSVVSFSLSFNFSLRYKNCHTCPCYSLCLSWLALPMPAKNKTTFTKKNGWWDYSSEYSFVSLTMQCLKAHVLQHGFLFNVSSKSEHRHAFSGHHSSPLHAYSQHLSLCKVSVAAAELYKTSKWNFSG